jgi:DNA-binding CsgD family transcriptional regulator
MAIRSNVRYRRRVLVGRAGERAAIDGLLHGARGGSSGVLVLRGPAGIGKTSLLDAAVASAKDFGSSRVAGVESEIALGFAAVHQLVLPFLDRVGDLPEPQGHALESVFGLADHGPPNPLLVSLAVLTLLDTASSTQPLLLVIDDAHWLDNESARLLAFVGRRLHADPIVMLFALRDPEARALTTFDVLPQLEMVGLSKTDSRALLEDLAGGRIDPDVAERLIDVTQGNPLALTEFVAGLDLQQLQGNAPLLEPLPVRRTLQDQFAARARALPPAGRSVLMLASAERFGDPALLHRAAKTMGVSWPEGVASVEAAGLATFTPAASFRHPLVRSAVYHSAAPSERRAAHRALADALVDDGDLDRRVWHLAAGAATSDEDIAVALERVAARVFQRGGTHAAAQFVMRAADLTPDPARKIDRLLAAVRMRSAEGDAIRAQPLLDGVMARVRDGRQRAEAEWTQGLIWLGAGRARDALRVLNRAVASIEHYDDGMPLHALITAETAVLYAGSLSERSFTNDIAAAVLRLLPEGASLRPTEALVRGIAIRLTDGDVAAAPVIRATLTGLRERVENDDGARLMQDAHEHGAMLHLLAVNAACAVLDDASLDLATRSWVDFGRRTRTLTTLPIALDLRAVCDVFGGRLRAAESAITEADDILSFSGARGHIGEAGVGRLFLDAYRGDEQATRVIAKRRSEAALERGSGADLDQAHFALAMLGVSMGRYEEALDHCRQIQVHDCVALSTLAFPLLIEAAVRCAKPAVANEAQDRFSERAMAAGTEWALGLLASTRALLAHDDDAEAHYSEALDRLARTSATVDLARVQLLYGEWLRRTRRRRDAREPLRTALDFFDRIGAGAFAERTRRELAATGEHSRPRSDATRDLLTAQEAQIAQLVTEGMTNPQIASQLYISKSTVEYHLRKVYRKLGVTSRTQLARLELSG